MRAILLCISLWLTASPAIAQQEALGLAAPDALADSGLLKHMLPRFSLKTGVRVQPDPAGQMVLAETPPGEPVFQGGDIIYYLRITETDARQQRFRDWLLSDIGKRTVESFRPEGSALFTAEIAVAVVAEERVYTGDAELGSKLSMTHCGRCHVISPKNRMNGLGSTPSFSVLRSLPDWNIRFEQFYVRRPHGAFTQVAGVTPPFRPELPPPIVPVEITPVELEAILAYVAATKAADLGRPLQLQ